MYATALIIILTSYFLPATEGVEERDIMAWATSPWLTSLLRKEIEIENGRSCLREDEYCMQHTQNRCTWDVMLHATSEMKPLSKEIQRIKEEVSRPVKQPS